MHKPSGGISTILKKPCGPQKLVRRNSDFFYALFINMFEIKKIESLNKDFINVITNHLESYTWDSVKFNVANNDTIYINENRPIDGNLLRPFEKTEMFKFNNPILVESLNKTVEYIKESYNPSIIWLMTYPPNTRLNFHVDDSQNRHILTFNQNDRFFNYEYVRKQIKLSHFIYENESYIDKEIELNNILKNDNFNLDSFNEDFLKIENTQIINLEKNSVYSFGNSLHNFINESDKLRMILVFENL
jgi:hypothetical protein